MIVGKYKYLDIWLKWNCKFKEHLAEIQTKVTQALNHLLTRIISESLRMTNFGVLKQLFSSLIHPILLYGAEVWGL